MEIVRNRIKVEVIKRDDNEKIIKQQSKLLLTEIHKSYAYYDSYTIKQNEVLMDTQIYLGFAVLESGKTLMYETYYDKVKPYFGEKKCNYTIKILIAS